MKPLFAPPIVVNPDPNADIQISVPLIPFDGYTILRAELTEKGTVKLMRRPEEFGRRLRQLHEATRRTLEFSLQENSNGALVLIRFPSEARSSFELWQDAVVLADALNRYLGYQITIVRP